MIIGITGSIGSGKDAVSEYLVKKYKYRFVSLGDLVREEQARRRMKISRKTSVEYQNKRKKEEGEDYWIMKAVKKIKRYKWKRVIVNGIRYPLDVEVLKRGFGKKFVLVKVHADSKIRYQRLKRRSRAGDPKTYIQFKKQDSREEKTFNLKKTFSFSDFVVKNNSTLEKVYTQTEDVLDRIKHKNQKNLVII